MAARLLISTGLPALSEALNVTAGALPGVALSTFRICRLTPGSVVELLGTTCAPGIEASKSYVAWETWQFLHWLSSNCGRFTWFSPLAKLTSSWQEPQAAREGLVFQLSACLVPPAWHLVPFRTSCGKTTSEKS